MNIVGEGFPDEIIKQIDQRQKILGSVDRNNETLTWMNSKTGWVKMVSSVNVTQAGIRNLPYTGDELAKNFILFNGTTSTITGARGGVWNGIDNLDNYAYGLGGTEFGLRPMPGINSANIKTETRGSLKTATISITAYNRQQFDIIDLLYMRLGYSVLLEWGHSSYFDNNGNYIANNPYSLANEFLSGTLKYDTYSETLQKKRLESNGNYDAIIGKVVNFNWSFNPDGSYSITVILRSMGDIIESLKTNILLPGSFEIKPGTQTSNDSTETETNTTEPTPDEVIKSFKDAHEIGKWFYKNQQILSSLSPGETNGFSTITTTDSEYSGRDGNESSVAFIKQTFVGEQKEQYYVRFGHFLAFLKKYIIPKVDNQQINILKINNRVKSNIIYTQSGQISSNPGVCGFKTTYKDGQILFNGCDEFVAPNSGTEKFNNNRYGYLMNIYINITFILTLLDSLKDEKGKVSLYDLLSNICQGICDSTGNVNLLEPIVDENEILIVDQTPLPDADQILNSLGKSTKEASFNVYGIYNNKSTEGGFIRDLSFNTTVSPNLATMITIGSTSNGYVLGSDSTALSRMNNGLVDRFKKEIKSPEETQSQPTTSSLENDYKEVIKAYNTFVNELSNNGKIPKWNQESINAFSNTQTQLLEYNQAKQTQAKQQEESTSEKISNISSPNVGFLPFDLQLTMDGLSGFKIYQKYTIDTAFLPTNYPTSLKFIIKGITQKIEKNEWTTTLESFAIPKNPFGTTSKTSTVKNASSQNNNRRTEPTLFTGFTPNADRLRTILTNLGYTEKGRELSSGGDITVDLVNYAAAVFREIKKQLPNVKITVTGGNDFYHQRLGYKSSHTYGQGLDFVISPLTKTNKNTIDKILGGFAAGNQSKVVSFINEYDYPSSAATAGHFHIRIGGKIESRRIATFIAQANRGQLITYPIT
jgi:hypothetical protein